MEARLHDSRRTSEVPAYMAGLLIWLAAEAVLFAVEPDIAVLGLSSAFYAILLAGLTAWRLPPIHEPAADDFLRASGARQTRRIRASVVLASIAWTVLISVTVSGLHGGPNVGFITHFARWLLAVKLLPHVGGMEIQNFLTLAVIPGALLLLLRTTPRELGLTRPRRGTAAAVLACLAVPAGFVVWAFLGKGLTLAGMAFLLLHNLLSNGFSEEFFARGMIFSQLRARLRGDWALMGQGLVFAAIHAGSTIAEEHGSPIRITANVVALNFPMGVSLGFMAIRSRSLVMPTIIHVSLDTMKDLLFWR